MFLPSSVYTLFILPYSHCVTSYTLPYHIQALQNALDVSLQLCLQIPLADIIAYVKLSKAYFGFLEVLFRNHLDVLSGLDSPIFLQLVKSNHEGLQSAGELCIVCYFTLISPYFCYNFRLNFLLFPPYFALIIALDPTICALCSSTIDHLATYMFLNQSKTDKTTVTLIRKHVTYEPDILYQLMTTLFNTLLFSTQANHWAVTRPILSLLLASESAFTDYQSQLINTQISVENREKLKEEFNKLLSTDIQRSVDIMNRDKFTQKLTMFRLNVRHFLTL